jgi:hypothetical protein
METKGIIFEINDYIIEINNISNVSVSVYSKRSPQVVFQIQTKFWAERFNDNNNSPSYLHLEKFPRVYRLNQFEVKKQDGLILVYNMETEMRICRIPIDFMNEVIDKCDKLVTACSVKPKKGIHLGQGDLKTIKINTNSKINFQLSCDSNLRPGYLSFLDSSKNGKYLADWMTILEYQNIPDYKISIKKKVDYLKTIEV